MAGKTVAEEKTPGLDLTGAPEEEVKIAKPSEPFEVETKEEGFAIVERRDTEQILAGVEGQVADEMVYSFKVAGEEVSGLTYRGICEISRIMQGIVMNVVSCEPAEWYGEEGFVALARSLDRVTGNGSSIIFFQPRWMTLRSGKKTVSRFAPIIAQSKAKRNATSDLLPLSLKNIVVAAALESQAPKALPVDAILAKRREQQMEARRQKALTSDEVIKGNIARRVFAEWTVKYKGACKLGDVKYEKEKQDKAFNCFLMAGWAIDREKGGSSKDLTVGQLEEVLLIVRKGEVDFLSGEILPGALPEEKKPEETG